MHAIAMESAKAPASSPSSSSSSPSTSRWNPTKEQIAVLEALYRQGIRTPSAEQIQQITGKLREFGDIEGKNVFYWFQNHKARQRQKQKQESFAYFSRLLHHPAPLPPPPPPATPQLPGPFLPPPTCTNGAHPVACSPYYLQIPQVGERVGFYQPHFPATVIQRMSFNLHEATAMAVDAHAKSLARLQGGYHVNARLSPATGSINSGRGGSEGDFSATLPLFPLHPTGLLEEKSASSAAAAAEAALKFEDDGDGGENQTLFNFFGDRKTKQIGW